MKNLGCLLGTFIVFACNNLVVAQEQKVYGDYKQIKIEDDVRWIEETPQRPEEYIGQVFLVTKDNGTLPYFAPISLPILVEDIPAVKKSILIKATKDGSVSFLDFFRVSAKRETVYQFQIVNSRRWSADTKSKEYIKAISSFRNDPTTSSIFESKEFAGIVMVSAVVAKKIWYKVYKSESAGGGGTYFVKVDGTEYFGSEDYEEAIRYGLLVRPLSGFGIQLPKTILNAAQITDMKVKVPQAAIRNLDVSGKTFAVNR